jgi:hypothetical protein
MRIRRVVAVIIALAFVPACGFSSPTGIQDDAQVGITAPDGTVAAGGYIGPDS